MPISKRDQRQTSAWWEGRTVVNTRPLANMLASLPAGTRWTVERKFTGLELVSHPCPCCGIRVSVKRVPFSMLDLVDDEVSDDVPDTGAGR